MGYAFKQAVSGSGAVLTFSPISPGNLLCLFIETTSGGGSPYITSLTDTGSGTWVGIVAAINNSANRFAVTGGRNMSGFYQLNCASGITSITAAFNGGTPGTVVMTAVEYSGIATAGAFINFNKNAQTNPGTGTDAVTSGVVSVSSAPALLLGLHYAGTGTANLSAGTGFTLRQKATTALDAYFIQDKEMLSTGSQAATLTDAAGAADSEGSIGVAFLEAAQGATPLGGLPRVQMHWR